MPQRYLSELVRQGLLKRSVLTEEVLTARVNRLEDLWNADRLQNKDPERDDKNLATALSKAERTIKELTVKLRNAGTSTAPAAGAGTPPDRFTRPHIDPS